MFKPVFLKQFRQFHFFKTLGYLYEAFEIHEKSTSAKKVALRDVLCTKACDNKGAWKAYTGFSLQHKIFSALNYAQDFGTTVKQSLKRTTSSKWATLKKSECHVMPLSVLSTVSLPSVQTVIKFTN